MDSTAFDRLLNDPDIADNIKTRIIDLKRLSKMSDDDPLLFYLAEFGYINKIFSEIPKDIARAAEIETERLRAAAALQSAEISQQIAKQAVEIVRREFAADAAQQRFHRSAISAATVIATMALTVAVSDVFERFYSISHSALRGWPAVQQLFAAGFAVPSGYLVMIALFVAAITWAVPGLFTALADWFFEWRKPAAPKTVDLLEYGEQLVRRNK